MLPSLESLVVAQSGIFTRAQALAAGYSPDEIRARLRSGAWTRVRHGVYETAPPADERERHLRRCCAALLVAGPDTVITGPSACVVHGLNLVAMPTQVHLASPRPRSAMGYRVRRAEFDRRESVEIGGLRVTALDRTAVETARTLDFADAVVAVDSALRHGASGAESLLALVGEGRDVVRARRVLQFADGRSESVGESLARVALDAADLPAPELQVPFVGASGRRYRVDFYWPDWRTIGEFDGRVKYSSQQGSVLWDEKRREDELRALGHSVVRFGSADLKDPGRLRALVHAGFRRGGSARASA